MLLNWLFNFKNKPINWIVVLVILGYGIHSIYSLGYKNGEQTIQHSWDKEKLALQEKISNMSLEIKFKEKQYQEISSLNQLQLNKLKREYEEKLNTITTSFNNELLESNKRASIYKHKAESGSLECRNLADHATRLDRSLTEGRKVVSELSEHIKLRDREIKALSLQLLNDRHLMEE